MAIGYTISYTFSPGTTISSSQVNTNFSDNANTWNGLEALTKSFAALRVDATPTATTDVAIKSYVDKLNNYRRPVLQYSSGTVVNIETGINGTSGQAQILFPDGTLRTDSTTTRIYCNLAQVAVLSGTAQSGLQTGTVANNTWYAIYAVKVTDSSTNFVTVADTANLPIQSKFSTLNSNFGTNGWVYLGLARYGDQSGTANAILKFVQAGSTTRFVNASGGNSTITGQGVRLATSASTTALSWAYAAGTSGAVVPNNIGVALVQYGINTAASWTFNDAGNTYNIASGNISAGTIQYSTSILVSIADGLRAGASGATAMDIFLTGYVDGVLGIGANPLL